MIRKLKSYWGFTIVQERRWEPRCPCGGLWHFWWGWRLLAGQKLLEQLLGRLRICQDQERRQHVRHWKRKDDMINTRGSQGGPGLPKFLDQPKQVRFQQEDNLGLRQLFLTVSWAFTGLSRLTWQNPWSSVYEAGLGPLKGSMSAQKALLGVWIEPRELLVETEEKSISTMRGHQFFLQAKQWSVYLSCPSNIWQPVPSWFIYSTQLF